MSSSSSSVVSPSPILLGEGRSSGSSSGRDRCEWAVRTSRLDAWLSEWVRVVCIGADVFSVVAREVRLVVLQAAVSKTGLSTDGPEEYDSTMLARLEASVSVRKADEVGLEEAMLLPLVREGLSQVARSPE